MMARTIVGMAGMGVLCAVGAIGTAAAQTPSSIAASPVSARGPLAMDLAGVRLGMGVGEAERILAATYRCTRFGKAVAFDEQVRDEVARRRGRSSTFLSRTAPGSLLCEGPSGERLSVSLVQTSGGPIVGGMNLTMNTSRVDPTAVERQVLAKYGRPTRGNHMNGSWCVGPCSGINGGPTFTTVSGGGSITMMANRGTDARKSEEAALKAAADRAAPPSQRGAF